MVKLAINHFVQHHRGNVAETVMDVVQNLIVVLANMAIIQAVETVQRKDVVQLMEHG